LEIVGGISTVRVGELLPEPVGACAVVTAEVLFCRDPAVVVVMLNVTVQLPLAGMLMPVKLSAVAPAVRVFGVVPVQEPPTAPPAAVML
jgi:hypothetical protein